MVRAMAILRPARQRIWERLRPVAKPDTRFHFNFADVIPDFHGSDLAIDRIVALPAFQESQLAFVTPDNSLVELRRRMIVAQMPFVMSTYGIARGFLYMAPGSVPKGAELYAAWLDGMEHFSRVVTLKEIAELGRFDLMITGASAVSVEGVRFGKGHGFFDLEWGMFSDLGLVRETTPVVAAVHDVQVVEDPLFPSETDIVIDVIATATRQIDVARSSTRPRGIRWDLLTLEQIAAIPPLVELARMRGLSG